MVNALVHGGSRSVEDRPLGPKEPLQQQGSLGLVWLCGHLHPDGVKRSPRAPCLHILTIQLKTVQHDQRACSRDFLGKRLQPMGSRPKHGISHRLPRICLRNPLPANRIQRVNHASQCMKWTRCKIRWCYTYAFERRGPQDLLIGIQRRSKPSGKFF